jgi:translocation and assembly module TamB
VKRVLFILAPPLIFLLVVGSVLKYYAVPAAEKWALAKLRSYSATSLPVILDAESVKFQVLKGSASIQKIKISGKGDLAKSLGPTTIESAKLNVDLFPLLTGRLQISAILIDSPQVSLQIDPFLGKDSEPKPLPLNAIFEVLEQIPMDRVFLHNVQLELESRRHKTKAKIESADLLLTNHLNAVAARIDIPKIELTVAGHGPIETRMDLSAVLGRDHLKILRAGARYGKSEVILKGDFDKFSQVTIHPVAQIEGSLDLRFEEIIQQLRPMLADHKLPSLQGSALGKVNLVINGLQNITGKAEVKTKDVAVDQFSLGNASLEGIFKDDTFSLSEVEIQHPAGKARLVNTVFNLDRDFSFKATAKVASLDLQKLFVSLNLKDIPVWMQLEGSLPCSGQLKSPFKVNCEGAISAENLLVTSNHKNLKAVIVDIAKISAKGRTEITKEGVTYTADLQLGNNTGSSSGKVIFAEGFNVSYKTPRLDFSNIRNLGNLKFKGHGSLDGTTKGNSKAGVFSMNLKVQDFVFEDYFLGDLSSELGYKTSHLTLSHIVGTLPKSKYQGNLDVDFSQPGISGTIKAPTLDMGDLVSIFEKHYAFPLTVNATGSAEMQFSGPLDFWKLSYQLDSRFKEGKIAGESFDDLSLSVRSDQGQMQIQKAILKKTAGTVVATGGINRAQEMNIKIEGRGFRLDESDFITRISSSIFGILNFTSQIKGKVTEPDFAIRGSVTETVLDEQEIPSSFFDFKVKKNLMEGNANLFGHRIQADWLLPFNDSPMRLRVKTVDWNYAALLAILGGNAFQNEYDSNLTADIDLKSESGQWQKATGNISIKNLYLKRGVLSLRNPAPIQIKMDHGQVKIQNFVLEGPQNSIRLKGQDFSFDNLDLNLVANAELRLFHMFLPFLEDIGGTVQTSTNISGSLFKPEILGSLSTNNSFVKIRGLPHPIERIQAEVNFSQSKVLLNSVRGQMAGGIVSADGNITFEGYHNLPTSIRIAMDNVTLNIPDRVRTSGSAELLLSGNWFPFLLSGTYRIRNGVFEREFTDSGTSAGSGPVIKQSAYLPKVLRQSAFEALVLEIQLLFEKSILVKNSMIDGSVQGNLQVKGPISDPILMGRLQTDKNTKLTFKDKIFEIQTGTVVFNNPNEINPDIYISAQSQVGDYDVMILAQGPAKNLRNYRLTSVPPLPESDIVSLLALGVTSTHMDQNVQGKDQAAQTGYELGFVVFAQPLNKQLQDRLGLNVRFSSSFDSTRNVTVPKLTLSRKISNKVNASTSRTLGSDVNDVDVKLQYVINQNISAIGSYENTQTLQGQGLTNAIRNKENVFGLDLEFKREFK